MPLIRPTNRILAAIALTVGCFISGCGHPGWQQVDSQNLRIHYRAGSVAAAETLKAVQIYERTYQAARQFLPADTPHNKIDIYLYDELTERAYADPEHGAVHIMYGPRYRLTSVHEFLVVMLVPLNPAAPPGIRAGLHKSQSKLRYAMQKRLEDRSRDPSQRWPRRPDLAVLIEQPSRDDETEMLAGSFIRFLLHELGEEAFWEFYREVTAENWREILPRYLQRSIEETEEDLRQYIIERVEQVPGAIPVVSRAKGKKMVFNLEQSVRLVQNNQTGLPHSARGLWRDGSHPWSQDWTERKFH